MMLRLSLPNGWEDAFRESIQQGIKRGLRMQQEKKERRMARPKEFALILEALEAGFALRDTMQGLSTELDRDTAILDFYSALDAIEES